MQEEKGKRALGVLEVTLLTVMRDGRGHWGIFKSWFHNKWRFFLERSVAYRIIRWKRQAGVKLQMASLTWKAKRVFTNCCPQSANTWRWVSVLAVKCFKMANVVSFRGTKETRESRNDWTIYKQDGVSVGGFLWKPLLVNLSSDPRVHAKTPVLRNDWFSHKAARPQCLMTQDGSSPQRRAHRKSDFSSKSHSKITSQLALQLAVWNGSSEHRSFG